MIASYIYAYVDLLWIPLALLVVHKGQRLMATGFILCCAFALRLQVEMLDSIGRPQGIFSFFETDPYIRGLVTYSGVIALFLILSYFSPRVYAMLYLAAGLSLFILAACITTMVMVL